MSEITILSRQLAREKNARKQAEAIAEEKSRVLYQANIDLTIRNKITHILVENTSLDEVTPKVLKMICETMNFDEGALWKVDHLNNVLRCVDIWSAEKNQIKPFIDISKQFTFLPGIGLPGRIWQSKSPAWVKDVVLDPNFPRAKWAKCANLHGAFGLPIMFKDEVLGVFEFFTHRIYTADDNLLKMLHDISNQMGIFIDREYAQKKVASLSRLAGMAEVASSVLHNIGNALNSINISAEMINEKIKHSKMENLTLLVNLLQQHKEDLETFLATHPKGKNVSEFLFQLSVEWNDEKKYLIDELKSLVKCIEHVKNIITTQQSLTNTDRLTEQTSIEELLDDVLTLNKIYHERASIEVIRDFSPIKKVITERTKLFQILMNVVKNGVDALLESDIKSKQLILRIHEKDDSHFMIQVSDNGTGILPANIKKIFTHGMTTKKTGHGFGLHTSALYAEELGGELFAESEGVNCGSTFTLILPYRLISQRGDNNEV